MPRGDPQKRDRGPLWLASTLLPVAQGMHADLDRSRELGLRQADEASQRRNVLSGFEASLHESLSQPSGNGSLQLFLREFRDVRHLNRSMCERYRACSRLLARRAPMIRTTFSSGSV